MPHVDTCVSTVLRQTFPDFELIFVDNNSTDGSLEYAKEKFPELVYVANSQNVGYAGGINSGLAHARGRYIAPLNMDTEVSPEWLQQMVVFLDENPRAGAVTPKILLFDDRQMVNTMGLNIHISGLAFCRGLGQKDDGSAEPQKVSGISGCSYLIRRELLESMGGAPEECFMASDDVVVSWLLNLMDWDMYCTPASVIYHKYSLKVSPEKFFMLETNRHRLLLYTLNWPTLAVCSPILGFTELLIMAYCLRRGKQYAGAKWRAMLSVIRDRSYIRERRRQLRRLRRVSDYEMLRRLKLNLEWGQLLQISG